MESTLGPTEARRSPASRLRCTLVLGMIVALAMVLTGCRSGTKVSRRDGSTSTSAVASQDPSGEGRGQRGMTSAIVAKDQSSPPGQSDVEPPARQRRFIPEWLRIGGDKEPVPLPPTPEADNVAAESSGGPVEEFQ